VGNFNGFVSRTSSSSNPNSRCTISVSGHTIEVPYEGTPAPALNTRCNVGMVIGYISATSAILVPRRVEDPLRAGNPPRAQVEIQQKYSDLGGDGGFLGKATMGLGRCPDGIGYFIHYEGGSIYWSPSTGAHEIHGAIREKWKNMGWERSRLGYPTSDETPVAHGRYSRFQNGIIYWSPSSGANEVHGDYNCAHCNDGSCQCGFGSGQVLCAAHRGPDPRVGCSQDQ
jgi:hypothetical protein